MVVEKRTCFVVVRGVAKRCRKEGRHVIDLGLHNPDGLTTESVVGLARGAVQAAGFKSVRAARVSIDFAEVSADECGALPSTMTWSPFDPRNVTVDLDVGGLA